MDKEDLLEGDRMSLKYNPTPFHRVDYKTKIKKELDSGRELNAFFLIYGYIEAYLREWLLITGNIEKRKIDETIIKEAERISFKDILLVHSILGNIDPALYDKIYQINKVRNELAHELIKIDIDDEKSKDKIKRVVLSGIEVCDNLSNLYRKNLDRNAKELIEKVIISPKEEKKIIEGGWIVRRR